jgi:predicted transcriptional regulator
MYKFRLFSLSLMFLLAFSSVFAQVSDDKKAEKQKQQDALLEQIAKDAEALRLPENRALVLAKLGDGYWNTDEKRARQFFQNAVNDLVTAQNEADADKKQSGSLYGLIYGVAPRQEILMLISGHDAELALESFYKSRPPKVARALTADNTEKKDSESGQYALNETNFEQSLISKIGDQSPQRAIKLFRESLSKGVTYEAFNFIEKLKTKDFDLAGQLAVEVADKLISSDFAKEPQASSLSAAFVSEYGKKPEPNVKTIKIEDRLLRDLMAKIVKNLMKSEENGYEIESLLPMIERFAPESLAALKQRQAKYDKENKREEYNDYTKLIESNPSPEKLLSEADKYPDDIKNQIYYSAAEKLAQNGNVEGAKKLIASKLPENERENYLTQINYNLIQQAITAEKYDEAASLINLIPVENSRFYFLIQLATTIHQKNPADNKTKALGVINQAREMIPQPVETLEDISLLMQLATTVSEIDAEQAFPILESLTYQINEYVEAAAIVGKYRSDGSVRRGEMIVNSYGSVSGLNSMSQILVTLKKKDFGRATAFVNGFQRPEVRVNLAMQLIDNLPATDTPVGVGGGNVTVGKAQ